MFWLRAFTAKNWFPSRFPSSKNKCARREYLEANHDILENVLTSSAAPGMVTRLAMYSVNDREHFMSFDTALLSNNILEVLRISWSENNYRLRH